MYEGWLENQIYRHVPEYYHGMEYDGFNYHEVKYAWKRQLFKEREEKRKAEEEKERKRAARKTVKSMKKEIKEIFKEGE